jgi:hypothetical protein
VVDQRSSKQRRASAIIETTRILLQAAVGTVFLLSAIGKLDAGPGEAVAAFGALGWLDPPNRVGAASALPYLELAVCGWLVSGCRPKLAALATTACIALFSVFLFLLGQRIGWRASCGCMGPFTSFTIATALFRNFLLLAALGAVFALSRTRRGAPLSQAR